MLARNLKGSVTTLPDGWRLLQYVRLPNRDYSGNYHGICQCENCREAFWKYARKPLPRVEDQDDRSFGRSTVPARDGQCLAGSIYELVKSFGDHVAFARTRLIGSTSSGVSPIVPSTGLFRILYIAPVKTRGSSRLLGQTRYRRFGSSFCRYSLSVRRSVASPNRLRLAQTIANGGGPDYYVISTLDRQWDRAARQVVSSWFEFHRRHQTTYRDMRPREALPCWL